jgi:hypothetical protein
MTPLGKDITIIQNYTKRTTQKIKQVLQKIPSFTPTMIEPLLIPTGTENKLYIESVNTGLSMEQLILFSIYEIVRVKNPKSLYDPGTLRFMQCCWINAEESFVPYSPLEEQLARVSRLSRNLYYNIEQYNKRQEKLSYQDRAQLEDIGVDFKRIEQQQEILIEMIKHMNKEATRK